MKVRTWSIGIIGFIGVFAKFSYIFFNGDRQRGEEYHIFGYKYLSHFLWAFGNEVFAFSIGVLLFVAANFFIDKRIANLFKAISVFTICTSFYFMGWIFFDSFYSGSTEILFAILFAVVATVLFVLFITHLTRIIRSVSEVTNYLTKKIRFLTDVIILKAPGYVRNQKVWHYDVVEPTMDELNE